MDSEFILSHDEKIHITKRNLITMLYNRNFIEKANIEHYIDELTRTDISDVYTLTVDNNKNYNTEIENGKIIIKYFDYTISSSSKGSNISDFINKNMNVYKILVVKDYVSKSVKTLKSGKNNLEIFSYDQLNKNLINHFLSPTYYVLNEDEKNAMLYDYNALPKDLPTMNLSDEVSSYYGLKVGDVCKIIRKTPNGESFIYRIVTPG